jgi:LPS-assembly lipoprotein
MNKPLRLSVIVLLLTVSACGWQLRGTGGEPSIARLHLHSTVPGSAFTQILERYLRGSGIELVDSAGKAEYSLRILEENSKRRTATVSASARISERLLEEQVEYLVTRPDGSIAIERSTASVERIYEYNEDNVLATEDEARLLKNEMYNDLARQIANRLRHVKRPTADNAAPTSTP